MPRWGWRVDDFEFSVRARGKIERLMCEDDEDFDDYIPRRVSELPSDVREKLLGCSERDFRVLPGCGDGTTRELLRIQAALRGESPVGPPEPLPRTLRDEFALAALQGLVGGLTAHEANYDERVIVPQAAHIAYMFADAMLVEREKKPDA